MPINKYPFCIGKQAKHFINVILENYDIQLYPLIADAVLVSVSMQQRRKQATETAVAPYPEG